MPDTFTARQKARLFSADDPMGRISISALARFLAGCAAPRKPLIVGLTGSVASGKSTLAAALADSLTPTQHVESISTDGFLFSNEVLASRGLLLRKGFPESYDFQLMAEVLQQARKGQTTVPGYSHQRYDRRSDLDRTIERPDILLVEGLGLSSHPDQGHQSQDLDLLIYLDASEENLEAWFVERFMRFWRDAETDPTSFYARFRSMSEHDTELFARSVWTGINLPNLRDHIVLARRHADIVIQKGQGHELYLGTRG